MSGRAERPLAGQPWLTAEASRLVLAALGGDGTPARFVGGCVRDGLLGRADAGRDLDLATPLPPEALLERLAAAGIRALPTGLAHGTVTALIDGQRFEITTLRRDVACDGRHAEVAFTDDFALDAARRDFTINAMACDGDGRLFDPFDGRADLAAGRVRFVGEAARRIAEDHLRILRYFRFFAHYGRPPVDPEALAACGAAAGGIGQLSGERVQAEMLKLLSAPDPLPTLRLMAGAGVLAEVLPAVALDRLAALLALAPAVDPLLRLGALLRPPPAPADGVGGVARRWRLSRRDHDRLAAMTAMAWPRLDAPPRAQRRALHRLGTGRFRDLIHLAAAEGARRAMASGTAAALGRASSTAGTATPIEPNGGAAPVQDARAALAAALATAAAWQPRPLPVTGDDLLALGVAPGPELGHLLAELDRWWADHDFAPDRAACLAHIRQRLDPALG